MAVREMRRLEPRRPDDPFQRAARAGLKAFWLNEGQFRRLQAERPDLVVEDARGILVGQPRGSLVLHFAFDDAEAFRDGFPAMFERLAARVRPEDAPPGIFIRFADRPMRPYVEPILVAQAFRVEMDWLEMYIPELAPPQPAEPPAGYGIRPARAEDAERVMAVAGAAFRRSQWTADALRRWIGEEAPLRVAVGPGSEVVGYVGLVLERGERDAVITDLAVHPDHRRRGLGRALIAVALGELHDRGARAVSLSVESENGGAIALCRGFGFKTGLGGVTYRRPTDPAELAQLLEKDRGTYVKFGGWR